MSSNRSSFMRVHSGFTLVELLIVVAIVVVLAVFAYAPYAYYGDVAKVRISVEKIEQAFSEARLSASVGTSVPGTDSNADVYVVLTRGSGSVRIEAARHASGFAPAGTRVLLREVPLERFVFINGLSSEQVVVKFESPSGVRKPYDVDGNAIAFTGGIVGYRDMVSGTLARDFRADNLY